MYGFIFDPLFIIVDYECLWMCQTCPATQFYNNFKTVSLHALRYCIYIPNQQEKPEIIMSKKPEKVRKKNEW